MSTKYIFSRLLYILIALMLGLTTMSTSYARQLTPQAPTDINALLLDETFDSNALPTNWQVVGQPGWHFNNPGSRTNETGGTGNMAIVDSDDDGASNSSLLTPSLDLSAATAVKLRFKTFFKAYDEEIADVDVSIDGGTTWTNIWRVSEVNYQGTLSLSVPQAIGQSNVKFRFHYYDADDAWYWQVDDVQVETPSAPAAPGALNAVESGSAVDLTWADNSDNEANFIIEHSPNGTDSWEEAGRVGANVTTFTHEDIECGTTVFYRVKAVNGLLTSAYSNMADVTMTACPFTGTGISENFDASPSLPTDWTTTGTWIVYSSFGNGFTGNVAFSYNYDQITRNATLKTPLFNMKGTNGVLLTFKTLIYLWEGSPDPQHLLVEISRDGGTSWEPVWEKTTSYNGNVSIDLSEWAGNRDNLMVRFQTKMYYGYVALDEVEIAPMPAPSAPSGLTATLSQYSDVILGWSGSSDANYRIERSDDNGSNWNQIADITNGATSYVDANVLTNSAYQYKVRAYNGAGSSPYSSIVSATTGDRNVRYVDVTISLHSGAPISTAADRAKYEAIIGYFAETVYEMSNGANRLREVTFYRDKMNFDSSHIQWIDLCHPNAYPNGYLNPEQSNVRILMCDANDDGIDYLNSEYGQKRGGYTLGHEWGHFFYGLLDEYQGYSVDPSAPYQPWSTDPGTGISIMNKSAMGVEDVTWLNLSTTTLNFTLESAQGRVYGADAWTVLARPKNQDPQIWPATERLYWPELAAAAPAAGETLIELPGAAAAARAELEIVWQPGFTTAAAPDDVSDTMLAVVNHVVREIVIDRSALMADSGYLDAVKTAVTNMIDQSLIGDTVGLVAFDGSVTEIQPLTDITDETVKDALIAALDGIVAGDANVAGGDALQSALTILTDPTVPDDATRAVYYITTGSQNTGVNPTTIIPDYQNANIGLYTFGFDPIDGDEANLRLLAELIGGDYTTVQTAADLQKALTVTEQDTSATQDVTLAYEDYWVTEPVAYTIAIDESLSEVDFEFTYYGEAISATITLESPNLYTWTLDPATDCETYDSGTDDVETTCYIGFYDPTVGDWTVYVDTTEDLFIVDIETAVAAAGETTYDASLTSRSGDVVTYPQPIVVEASVSRGYPIGGLYAYGYLYAPNGDKVSVDFKDDGAAPDRIKDDGIYSAYVNYTQNGEHWVTVHFDNYDGLGFYTDASLNTTDPVPLPDVTESFERYAEIQLTVQDWQEDDHADWPDDPNFPATALTLDNVLVPGRIDVGNDVDMFEVTVPLDYAGSTLGLRINQLGLGMDPYVYVYAADGSWEFERYLDYIPTSDDALFIPLDVNPGETIYVEVWHYDEMGTGTYSISAGKYLWSDPIAKPGADKLFNVFLPLVVRN
ncbi:MAG: VWA domain-containing protein [Ardenticatenaceae bacterium]|nr:VWA domain-containing protein [Ardenticatenaceae bacterium]